MTLKTAVVLALVSLLNAGVAAVSFLFWVFATDGTSSDTTLRVFHYILPVVLLAAVVGVFLPWILALFQRHRMTWVLAALPTVMLVTTVVAFLLLDGWIRRTF